MKIKILIALLLVILTIGAANAADNITSDNLVASENLDIQSSNVTESSIGDFSDLFNLINCSSETLELDADYTNNGFEDEITILKPITIDGKGHTLNANHSSRIFNINADNVILKNINFKNGGNVNIGGAIYSNNNQCSIINSTFIDCRVNANEGYVECNIGGAIYSNGNDWNIIDTAFLNCRADVFNNVVDPNNNLNHGGGIYAIGDNWNIINTSFTKCLGDIGGSIYAEGANWKVVNSTFTKSTASFFGGAIYTPHGQNSGEYKKKYCNNWNIINSKFTQCTSDDGGGAVFSNGANWNIINSKFTKCTTKNDGGAIYATEKNCSVISSTFSKCSAKWDGGAIFFKEENPKLLNSKFQDNTANKYPNWYSKYPVITTITAKNMKVTYTSNSYYTIKVYDTTGKLANSTKVTIKINGKSFKTIRTTKGVAKFKVTQKPGIYKLTITALSNKATKTLTVKHIISLKNIEVKKSAKKLTLEADLIKVDGKILKNKPITFKFNGKTYKAKTNSKGIAKVTIKSTELKKLKVGKTVSYHATYMKDTVKKTAKIQK